VNWVPATSSASSPGRDGDTRCRVLADKAEPGEAYGPGPLPKRPVASFGWGSIPAQWGRKSFDDDEEE
jgi:hypothetical protein